MELNDLYGAGSDIMDAVTDAVNRQDYSHLSEDIAKTVNDIRIIIQREKLAGDVRRRGYRQQYAHAHRSGAGHAAYGQPQVRRQSFFTGKVTPFLQKKISRTSGTGRIVLGIIGLLIGVPTLLGGLISGLTALAIGDILAALIVGGGITALSLWGIFSGDQQRKLVNRYYQYGRAAGDAEYIEISQLAAAVGRKTEDVREDIKKMMDKGLLPVAWLDDQETTLILSEEMYNLYRQSRSQMQQREMAQEKEDAQAEDIPSETRKILEEGNDYIRRIRRYNDEIPGMVMSDKLDRLESTMNRIMEQVRKNPGSAPELRKLMGYYLPTTVKLLNAYVEQDKQSTGGENIVRTKQEIEGALDTINDAFENLLDSLFQDLAWDISSDISVMQTMLKQDGLTEREMRAGSGAQTAPAQEKAPEDDSENISLVFGEGGMQYQKKPE